MRSLWTFLFVVLLFAPGVNAQGIISTVAGNGTATFGGDGGAATSASLSFPFAVAVDTTGNLFIVDRGNVRIRRVDATTGIITTVAGNGVFGFSGDGGPATSAALNFPGGVTLDAAGNLFIADSANHRIRRVDAGADGQVTGAPDETITTVAGDGSFTSPLGVALDAAGNLFFTETEINVIRRVDAGADGQVTGAADETITTVVGSGPTGGGGFSGDGGPAISAHLATPTFVALDAAGNLFIADSVNQRIRRVDAGADGLVTGAADETITTVAGSGPTGFGSGGFSGDGGPATSARFATPTGVALDAAGNLFIADTLNHRIRRVQAPVTAVDIDIKPGSDPNAVNPTNRGLVPVAILTTDTFDATSVSPITVRFGPAGASPKHQLGHLKDVDSDGDLDLVLHFRTQEAGIQCGDTEASLTGETFDWQAIQGSDSIVTVGCN